MMKGGREVGNHSYIHVCRDHAGVLYCHTSRVPDEA